LKSPEGSESPMVLFGPRGGGKTSKLISWLTATPVDGKLKVFLCANRLARHQAGLALDKITNGNLLGYNAITYYELIAKITRRSGWGAVDWSDFFDPEFLQGLNSWLKSEVGAIVLDQAEALKEAGALFLQSMPGTTMWAMGHSAPDSSREEITEGIGSSLRKHLHWLPAIDRPSSSLLGLEFDDSEKFWTDVDSWMKRALPDCGFDANRAWSRVVVLGSDLGFIEARLKQKLLLRYGGQYPEMWVSGLSKGRIPHSTVLTVVREYEGYSVESKLRLVIRLPNFSDKSEFHDFPTEPILKGQPITPDFIQLMSVKALNNYDLYCDGRAVVANDISIHGSSDEWWVEIIDSSSYRRVSPFKLKWHKTQEAHVTQKSNGGVGVRSSERDGDQLAVASNRASRVSNLMRKLQAMDKKLLSTMTARELGKLSVRYKGKEAIVVDVNIYGSTANWWLEILTDTGRFRVHPNELTYR
jgi:hypothetical protein